VADAEIIRAYHGNTARSVRDCPLSGAGKKLAGGLVSFYDESSVALTAPGRGVGLCSIQIAEFLMKNLSGLMKQAQQMQEKMQEMQSRLEGLEVQGEAGAGLVTVTMNGKGDLRQVRIDPKVIDPADAEMLQDLIVAAHANARQKVEAAATAEMQKVTGGMQLPPGMKLPF
jgi:nucleoid-associated protein EbfC